MGARLAVTPGFWLTAALLWVIDPQLLLPAALAAALHEGGHVLALRLMGVSIRQLRLTAAGLALLPDGLLSYRKELWAAAAGPAVSLLSALLSARMGHYLFAGVSFSLGLFNLLPIPPLDGGRVFRALVSLLLPPEPALSVSRWTGAAAAGAVLGVALIAFARVGGLSFLLLALWLAKQAIFGEKYS